MARINWNRHRLSPGSATIRCTDGSYYFLSLLDKIMLILKLTNAERLERKYHKKGHS